MAVYRCSRKADSENRITTAEQLLDIFHAHTESSNELLRFEFNKRYYVEVIHSPSKGYFVYCFHEQHSFETLVPYDGVLTGFTIEEFLDDFWNHRVRQKYNFDTEPEIQNPDLTVESSFRISVFLPLVFFILPLVYAFIDKREMKSGVILNVELIVLAATAPYWLLLIQYFIFTRNSVLRISVKEKMISMSQNGTETTMRLAEITKVKIIGNGVDSKPIYGYWKYLRIEAGPQKRIIVTDLLYENLERLVEMIGCKVVWEPSFYAWIRLKRKSEEDVAEEKAEFAEKSAEFEERWKNKSREELEEVIKNADQYADFAVDTAKRLLKRK